MLLVILRYNLGGSHHLPVLIEMTTPHSEFMGHVLQHLVLQHVNKPKPCE